MNHISELKGIIEKRLGWHKSRVDCFALLLVSLFRVCSVNMRALAVAMDGTADIDSRTKRVYRFFAHFKFDLSAISVWLFDLFFSDDSRFYIAIDRTNWKWGSSPINIFMLSICYEGISIPVMWRVSKREGMTTGHEQIAFCNEFIERFGQERIEGLLADREFANKRFITWLRETKLPFYIRIKGDSSVFIKGKKYKKARDLFTHVQCFQHYVFPMYVEVFGAKHLLAASKNERGDLMIILTNAKHSSAIPAYLRRWEIETLFQSLKGRGFNFEDTHVTKPERIEKIIALLAVGFAWAHKTGEWRAEIKPIPMKSIKKQRRPQYSYFRYGLDYIRGLVSGFSSPIKTFRECLQRLEPGDQGLSS